MSKHSLRTRMMILILAPAVIIGVLVSGFFVAHRYSDLCQQLEQTGTSIIEPLAITSGYEISQKNPQAIRQIINLLHRRHSDVVRAIALYDSDNQLRVTSNIHTDASLLRTPAGEPMPSTLTVTHSSDTMILRTPIVPVTKLSAEPPTASDNASARKPGYVALMLDMRPIKLQQYREITIAGLLICCCLICALLFVWRLMHGVTEPILSMVNTVDRIRQGQLSSRVTGVMPGELETLKNGINAMAASLADYRQEMQHSVDQATADLRETLEQMEIQNVELDLAKKRAQEAARSKSNFLANMSHELRTPLNGVIGFTRLMLKTGLTVTQRNHLHTIERSANNLLTLINNVLDFSKLEAEKLPLERIPFSLRRTLDDVVTLLANAAHDKGLELTLTIKRDVPDNVIGDPLRLQQIITNLVGNAIKFTQSGNIDILLAKRAISTDQVEIDVQIRDSGTGIPVADQAQLFQAFRQADASICRRHGGTGLGLVITQRLISEMGGGITFHSEVGRGTTFFFHIRLALNPNSAGDTLAMDCLAGKRLAFVEANPVAAQSVLEILASTPLTVIYRSQVADLPAGQVDIMLLSAPVTLREPLTMRHTSLSQAATLTHRILLALPCHAQVNAELLKQQGIAACLQKPITASRLIPLLLEHVCAMNPPATAAAIPPGKLPMTVMAVDDNPANLKLLGALLHELVQHSVLCDNGIQAVQQAQNLHPDLILMDIHMPDMDGIRACEMIRQLPQHRHTPIIAVTAQIISHQSVNHPCINDYLEKPIDEDKLQALLLRYQPNHCPPQPACPQHKLPDNAPANTQTTSQPPPVLDWQLALRQAAGKTDLARDMLQMLADFLPAVRDSIRQQLAGENPPTLAHTIHKLHGSCCYTGTRRLQNICHQIEQQLADGNSLPHLEPELLELLDEINNAEQAIQTLTNHPTQPHPPG